MGNGHINMTNALSVAQLPNVMLHVVYAVNVTYKETGKRILFVINLPTNGI